MLATVQRLSCGRGVLMSAAAAGALVEATGFDYMFDGAVKTWVPPGMSPTVHHALAGLLAKQMCIGELRLPRLDQELLMAMAAGVAGAYGMQMVRTMMK